MARGSESQFDPKRQVSRAAMSANWRPRTKEDMSPRERGEVKTPPSIHVGMWGVRSPTFEYKDED